MHTRTRPSPLTAWHHLGCVVPMVAAAADMEGFDDLDEEFQEQLVQRVESSRGEVDELYQARSTRTVCTAATRGANALSTLEQVEPCHRQS
jgi:hypothetical protein